MSKRKLHLFALVVAVLALVVAGCGGDDDEDEGAPAEEVSGTVEITGVWTGQEAKSFQEVLNGFEEQNPDATVKYNAAGDQIPTVLATAVEGGNPPDLAAVPQPGLVRDFFDKGALQPMDFAEDEIRENFTEGAVDVATFDDQVYGFLFKAANKSTVWYNVGLFEAAGVEPPETFDDFLANAETLRASGTKAYSIGVDAGWPLTDLFENIYLRQAGPEMYDQLAAHEIPWTDQSVKDALTTMAEVVGDSGNIVGGTSGALETDFPTSVTNAFKEDPDGAQVIEADFVASEITASTPARPLEDFDVFEFPSVEGSEPVVVGGGDTIIMFEDTPAAQALVRYLASAEAAEIWASRGGFSSANRDVDPSVYPDELSQRTATAITEAETFRFDLSDLQPAEFGATVGQGLWKHFTDFMENPDDVDGAAQKMEQDAKKAF
jgi:alpha-glucoside transport system substrate-binding protein